ncbi:phosphoribulokinase [Microbulbifer sp. OS29]|uniref:Phosphoribulokinase n=1 Tax=Microbulbifer okhotskensis TaxID=2926617 RepID=A0A9X2J3N5_9GAMM|nr:phosphoribulokinase [Microbulbifer okhotskensis]MCO1333238.1 phosphoribulokinase [Microbulbifer okhotskensis]
MDYQWPAGLLERSEQLYTKLAGPIKQLIAEHQLPIEFYSVIRGVSLPLALWILKRYKSGSPLIVGISGGQGTGKSTLAEIWKLVYQEVGYRCCTLSLDDIYLTLKQRQDLARTVHPLLETRGVPGTHDVNLGISTLNTLCSAETGSAIAIPRFDKARDDRFAPHLWPVYRGQVDIILFEGWCLGAKSSVQPQAPLNELESSEDRFGHWRGYVNQQLDGPYRELFAMVDTWVMLKAPSMESIIEWRRLQEQKLRMRSGGGMTDNQIVRFVQHFERVTRNLLRDMPAWADCVLDVGEDHLIRKLDLRLD